jgi:hypothetical protein
MSQLSSHALAGGERQDAIDHCLAGISRLSNEVTDASGFIPPYDQRTYGQVTNIFSPSLFNFANMRRQSKLLQRSCKKLDLNLHQDQDFSSRQPKIVLRYLSTTQRNSQLNSVSSLPVEGDLAHPPSHHWRPHPQTS